MPGDEGEQEAETSTLSWSSRLTNLPSSIAEGVHRQIDGASNLLRSTPGSAHQRDSWKRRVSGIKAQLTPPRHSDHQDLLVSPEVQRALRQRLPVVALESTIISHGMPYPQNLETAEAVEQIVRQEGAVPATIAILDGRPCVGLTTKQLLRIAVKGKAVIKTSRRDLPHVLAKKLDGACTVSATMLLAARAGIPVFVTGGIGGVHRGGQDSLDISSDLTEFVKSPIAVVCAGAKSILDIPRTLEYLETQGVTVAGYGTDEFPAFFSPRSGCKVPCRVDTAPEAAAVIASAQQLGIGVLIGVPIPAENAAASKQTEAATVTALEEASEMQLRGAEITPFLLQRVQEITKGDSLAANISLIRNNARIGAQIAAALSTHHSG